MGKAAKWLRTLFGGSKKKKKNEEEERQLQLPDQTRSGPLPWTSKEKKRWSFRRSAAARKEEQSFYDSSIYQDAQLAKRSAPPPPRRGRRFAAEARTTSPTTPEESASLKIQSAFRGHLARKALRALKGVVKIQALVRGHLVRKQASYTLRCMETLLAIQTRARAHRAILSEQQQHPFSRSQSSKAEEKGKITPAKTVSASPKLSSQRHQTSSRSSSETTEMIEIDMRQDETRSPFTYLQFHPNYMANTESSRAKARSQSAPRQRSADGCERRRSSSVERRNIPRCMQLMKLDVSNISFKESECGSSCTVSNY